MKKLIQFSPVRFLASLAVLLHAVVALAAFRLGWDGQQVILIDGVVTGFVATLGTFFVEARTVSTAALDVLAAAQQQVEEVSPDALDTLAQVAQDALRGEGNTALRG